MPPPRRPTIGNCTVLPADNIWNTRIDQLPVHPSSSTWVTTIGASSPVHPDFGSGLYQGAPIGIPFVTVPGTQTLYPATFTYHDESDTGPYAIPLTAPIEGGSSSTGDRHAISVDVNHCILYEIYNAFPQTASWKGDSGAIFNLLSDALRPATWTSADAAGLPIFPGLLRYDEVAAGEPSTTPSASPSRTPRKPTCGPRATTPPRSPALSIRPWARASACKRELRYLRLLAREPGDSDRASSNTA